jgi:predicted methyltransferase
MSNWIIASMAAAACIGWAGCGAAGQAPSSAISAAIADPGRPPTDTQRDTMRHPAEVLAFAGVKPGQKIAEFAPGGGYFTRLLAKTVGGDGHVYSIVLASLGDRAAKGAASVASTNPNVSLVSQTGNSFVLPEKVDVAWITDNYHDFHNASFGPLDMGVFDKAIYDALKPGGVLLIEDYQTVPGAGASQTSTLHRMEEAAVRTEVTSVGFVYDGQISVLNNPKDDHTLKIFDPAIRGEADQYVLRFRKPE